jgi:hypothetical protein
MTALLQRWRTRIGRGHPSTDRLLEEVVFGAPDAATALSTARHLRRCAPCAQRAGELRTFLDTLADAAGDSFDETFPPDRLQVQRARIDHRLAQAIGRIEPARVLAFPFRRAPERRVDLGPGRWAAATTAVGLALGMVTGQLLHFHRNPAPAPGAGATFAESRAGGDVDVTLDVAGTIELPPSSAGGAIPTTLTLSEFERVMAEAALLDTFDVATISLPVTELAWIDALTPHVSDPAATAR